MDSQQLITLKHVCGQAGRSLSPHNGFEWNPYKSGITQEMNNAALEGIYQKHTVLREQYARLNHLGITILR